MRAGCGTSNASRQHPPIGCRKRGEDGTVFGAYIRSAGGRGPGRPALISGSRGWPGSAGSLVALLDDDFPPHAEVTHEIWAEPAREAEGGR